MFNPIHVYVEQTISHAKLMDLSKAYDFNSPYCYPRGCISQSYE